VRKAFNFSSVVRAAGKMIPSSGSVLADSPEDAADKVERLYANSVGCVLVSYRIINPVGAVVFGKMCTQEQKESVLQKQEFEEWGSSVVCTTLPVLEDQFHSKGNRRD
jgi:hypothetical protein